jgi:phosphatidylglycerol---prolipoprotein diacylglyceryl transferase
MQPVLFHLPFVGLPIYGFGTMLVIGLLLALHLAKRLARARNIDGELFVNLALLMVLSGVVGARISHILENLAEYTDPNRSLGQNLLAAVNITSGGLTFYGGFVLAFVVGLVYIKLKKLPVRVTLDLAAPCVMIGVAFGRIGCLLNGCCFGAQCDLPWAVRYPYGSIPYESQYEAGKLLPPAGLRVPLLDGGETLVPRNQALANPLLKDLAANQRSMPVHPTQLYQSLTALLLAAITLAHLHTPHSPGRTMAVLLMLEGVSRFCIELLRVEPAVVRLPFADHSLGLSISMLLGLFITGIGLLLWTLLRPTPPSSTVPQPA